ncbi:MAG: DUF3226 domain-containing protein [Coleofasciculus sp. C1-SOL-03]|uniref:DUF3226 domain-containing protein n=1 Tax=Coleofasciculus sp. C1-SOL-03 TaxID=3069522 RepID=UPI00330206DB
MVNYAIIGVEGSHDQAFVGKGLKLLGFKDFRKECKGLESELDPFWRKFIPTYPKKGNLYKRLDMPSILFTESLSVAVYAGEGSNLVTNLDDIICNNLEYQTNLAALGIVADADKKSPDAVVNDYSDCFQTYFSNFPAQPGEVDTTNTPRTGIYVLPDNRSQGVLDTLLCHCGEIAYPAWMERSRSYLAQFSEEERRAFKCKWKPFDEDKALVAAIVSILKPGKTNTVSISDNNWVSAQTQVQVPTLANFLNFLRRLLSLSEF